ncbi:MAG: DUF4252 domain-containing protein [Opitutaceae bacterium]|nr:DUF4252 domain-containing protein [Opitutaceae bacterium]
MKSTFRHTILSLAAVTAFAATVSAVEPGYVDFEKLVAPEKGQYVEITLGPGLLKLASVIARCKDAETAGLISGVSRVRVNVARLDERNRSSNTERINALREKLVQQGWEPIAKVRGDKDEDVAVFVKQRDGEVIEGVVVTVVDGRKHEAVFINVVGSIRPEQLAAVGQHLQIKHLAAHGGPKI